MGVRKCTKSNKKRKATSRWISFFVKTYKDLILLGIMPLDKLFSSLLFCFSQLQPYEPQELYHYGKQ